jgi:hypothetical protein
MAETSPTTINLNSNEHDSKFLGISTGQWIKGIGLLVVVMIIVQLISSFTHSGGSSILHNLSEAFGNATGALAWASGHWYLFLVGALLTPFVPAAGRWAAKKASGAITDKTMSTEGKTAYIDALIYLQKTEDAKSGPDAERAKNAEIAKDAKARFDEASEQGEQEARSKLKENGLEMP